SSASRIRESPGRRTTPQSAQSRSRPAFMRRSRYIAWWARWKPPTPKWTMPTRRSSSGCCGVATSPRAAISERAAEVRAVGAVIGSSFDEKRGCARRYTLRRQMSRRWRSPVRRRAHRGPEGAERRRGRPEATRRRSARPDRPARQRRSGRPRTEGPRSAQERLDLLGELGGEDDVVDEAGAGRGEHRLGMADGGDRGDDAGAAELVGPHPDHAVLDGGVPHGTAPTEQDPADLGDDAGVEGALLLGGAQPAPEGRGPVGPGADGHGRDVEPVGRIERRAHLLHGAQRGRDLRGVDDERGGQGPDMAAGAGAELVDQRGG